MNFKHFIKTLLIFTVMIFVGLLGVFLLNYFNKSDIPAKVPSNMGVAK
jgi:cell division protein FtsX